MLRNPLLSLTLALCAAGCSTPSDKAADTDTDGTTVPEDTFPEDTAPEVDTTPDPADPDDTGSYFIIEVEGRAEVVRGTKFVGWQTLTAKWIKGLQTPGKPRCIYEQNVVNWERDPLREGETNPLSQADFDACPSCAFAFTVTLEEPPRVVEHYPWSEAPVDSDTDDTDVPQIPPDVVGSKEGGRTLNCDTLQQRQGYPTPEDFLDDGFPNWAGFAFDADADNDDDVTTGYLLVWFQRYGTWSPYAYNSTFDAASGAFTWSEALPYEYAY